MKAPLKLVARDADDLAVISAAVQDSVGTVADLAFLDNDRQFVLALSRFRWEEAPEPRVEGETYERIHSALTIENVTGALFRGIDRSRPTGILSLLAVEKSDDGIDIVFSGNAAIRLHTSGLLVRLEDYGEPWPTVHRPGHPDVEEG